MAIGTTAAALGAAAIGGLSSVASGIIGSNAAGKASETQAQAADKATALQAGMAAQGRIDAYPWALIGAQALYKYADEMGIPRPQTPILPDLSAGPLGVGTGTSSGTPPKSPKGPKTAKTPAPTPSNPAGSAVTVGPNGETRIPMPNGWTRVEHPGGLVELLNPAAGAKAGVPAPAPPRHSNPTPAPVTPSPSTPALKDIPMTAGLGFRETPGYQFQVEEGEKSVLNNMAAMGMKNSGAALKALTKYRQGVADQTYGTYMNRLASAAGMGQTQVNAANSALSQAGVNIAQGMNDAGAARASGYVGQANAWSNALSGAAKNTSNALGWLA